MVRVEGHWRNRSWVRTHYRHPLRPEAEQTVLVFPRARPVRLDPSAHGGPFPSSPVDEVPVPRLPSPRPPS